MEIRDTEKEFQDFLWTHGTSYKNGSLEAKGRKSRQCTTTWPRIEFKILSLSSKAYYEIRPKYLTDILIKYILSRKLRSANKELSVVPKHSFETYGKRAFSVIVQILWNNLPELLHAYVLLKSSQHFLHSHSF